MSAEETLNMNFSYKDGDLDNLLYHLSLAHSSDSWIGVDFYDILPIFESGCTFRYADIEASVLSQKGGAVVKALVQEALKPQTSEKPSILVQFCYAKSALELTNVEKELREFEAVESIVAQAFANEHFEEKARIAVFVPVGKA